ncbi:sialic acid-binding Ig-like lectin 8 [Pseudophryne corroboree]|uniref:sialic acid-binding Ig-like lectin 8 n=1 Tax=Pseudophryne corroboree TaxID=495146 RepID=UPI003081B1D2
MGLSHLEHCLSLVFLMSLIWGIGGQQPGYNIYAPREVTVQEGLCVHIPCTFTVPRDVTLSQNARGYWYRPNSNGERVAANDGSSISDNAKGRFYLIGDVSRGDCSLSINSALSGDTNYYQFRLEDTVRMIYRDIVPHLTVTALRDQPEISPVKSLVAGEEVTLTCMSPGRCSGYFPTITWTGVKGTSRTFKSDHTDGNRTFFSNFTFTASERDNQSPLTCTVTFHPSMVTTSKTVILHVESFQDLLMSTHFYDHYSTDNPSGDPPSTNIPTGDCRNVDYKIIGGIVAGNVIILILISLGLFCFLKRYMEKRPLGSGRDEREVTEPTYQDLKGQKNDIYSIINTQ